MQVWIYRGTAWQAGLGVCLSSCIIDLGMHNEYLQILMSVCPFQGGGSRFGGQLVAVGSRPASARPCRNGTTYRISVQGPLAGRQAERGATASEFRAAAGMC
jgi:hypothetical protein